ncbi:MAG: hypothetical protein AAGH79_08075 [Bacteroidota bacterium]
MFLIKSLIFLCVCVFAYALLEDYLKPAWEQPAITQGKSTTTLPPKKDLSEQIIDGVHVQTGLIVAEGFDIVRGTCTACHSAKLITQNRATRSGWKQMIIWMRETQGLWDLGDQEPIILNYLAKHYAPKETGRRPQIDVAAIEWYILEIEE